MIGRGSRIAENKEKFIILDLGNNAQEHGLFSQHVDWTYYFKHSEKNPM